MTREELQAKLQEITERQKASMRQHEARLNEIQEAQQATLADIEDRKFAFLTRMKQERREADRQMRSDHAKEQMRWKAERIELDRLQQRLFADYKAEKTREETEAADD